MTTVVAHALLRAVSPLMGTLVVGQAILPAAAFFRRLFEPCANLRAPKTPADNRLQPGLAAHNLRRLPFPGKLSDIAQECMRHNLVDGSVQRLGFAGE
jgi:hypothetical protein